MSDTESGDDPGREAQVAAGGGDSFFAFVAGGAWKLATGAPRMAADFAIQGAVAAERHALLTLKRRLDFVTRQALDGEDEDDADFAAAAPATDAVPGQPATIPPAPLRSGTDRRSAATLMSELLENSLDQSVEQAREQLARRIVRELVPDEARILAALADGHAVALMHLGAGPMVGPATQRWLENLGPVGKEAGVRLLDESPRYVTHLRALGLLESGPEDKSLQIKYQLIEADTLVRQTCTEIEKAGLRPRYFRRTLKMSAAGKAFWSACEPADRPGW